MKMEDETKKYKDRFRVFLILYIFSEPFNDEDKPNFKKVFESEMRIQKLDFLFRYPDYLCHELLLLAKNDNDLKSEVKDIVKDIYANDEPIIRKEEMLRFFFGAYEDIDNIIAFLKSVNFIHFESKKRTDLKTATKKYYITDTAISKFNEGIENLPALKWYINRCELIKKYFGNLSATQLKISQYQVKQYSNTSFNEYIGNINEQVKREYFELYLEKL